jgi:hypothetical protein
MRRTRGGWSGWALCLSVLLACTVGRPSTREAASDPASWEEAHAVAPGPRLSIQPVLLAGGPDEPGAPEALPGLPLTRARLRELARSKGIGVSGAPVTCNWEVGKAFQRTALRSLDIPENFLPYATPKRVAHKSVIPDGVLVAGRINLLGGVSFRADGAFVEVIDSEFVDFCEAKALSNPITLSTGRGQIQGFIEALARMRPRSGLLGPPSPRPALLLVTTSDTTLSEQVELEAGRRGIAVYLAVAREAGGLISVGPFIQKTGFSDVPPRFQMTSIPQELRL